MRNAMFFRGLGSTEIIKVDMQSYCIVMGDCPLIDHSKSACQHYEDGQIRQYVANSNSSSIIFQGLDCGLPANCGTGIFQILFALH
jgi:hypothetical protein